MEYIVVMEIYCNDKILNSVVDAGTKGVLYLLRKDPTRTKSTKKTQKTQNMKKAQKSDFLHLRCFHVHKKYIKHKTSYKRLLPVRCFYAHKNAVFFIFIRLCAFCAFYVKQATFFVLDVFYAHLKLFLFLFAYVRFVLFVLFARVGSFGKKS